MPPEPPGAGDSADAAELQEYLHAQGDWAAAAATAATALGSAMAPHAGGGSMHGAGAAEATEQCSAAVAEVVAELAALAQKLHRNGWKPTPRRAAAPAAAADAGQAPAPDSPQTGAGLPAPDASGGNAGELAAFVTAAEAAAGSGAAPGADVIQTIPLKLAVVSSCPLFVTTRRPWSRPCLLLA